MSFQLNYSFEFLSYTHYSHSSDRRYSFNQTFQFDCQSKKEIRKTAMAHSDMGFGYVCLFKVILTLLLYYFLLQPVLKSFSHCKYDI